MTGTVNLKKGLLAGLIMVSLMGCSTIPLSPIVKEKVLVADFDSVWEATIETLKEGNFVIGFANKKKGIIQTKTLKLTGEVTKAVSQGYNRIFNKPSEGTYDLRIKIRVKNKDRTGIRIDTRIRANFPKHGWYIKSSSGVIEERIFSTIMRKLNQYELLHDWF
jgi:hypothetical protein